MSNGSEEYDAPMPVVPIPVSAVPPPYPLYPPRPVYPISARPGTVTLIGVLSLIVAAISLVGGTISWGINSIALRSAHVAATMQQMPAVPQTPFTTEVVSPNGLNLTGRTLTTLAMTQVRTLTEAQKDQLDEMLAEQGQQVMPHVTDDSSVEQIRAYVSSSGHLDGNGETGTDYFVLGSGRLELTDDGAVFFPTGSQPPVRTTAFTVAAPSAVAGMAALQPVQIKNILRQINAHNGKRISKAQTAAVNTLLQSPTQAFITAPTDGSDPASQIDTVQTSPDGHLQITSHHGTVSTDLQIDPSGAVDSTNTIDSAAPVQTAAANIKLPDQHAAQWVSPLAELQLATAVYLLVCGIFVLRGSALGGRLHWIFAGVKIPLAVASVSVAFWLWHDGLAAHDTMGSYGAWMYAGPALAGLVYPLVLIGLLLTKPVRGYFSAA